MNGLILATLIVTTALQVKGSPWIFQEIKPISASDNVKKSAIIEKPVKEIDPTKTYITIKEDIQKDITGGNETSSKYKEGVQKLLDFLGAGPMVNDTAKNKSKHDSTTTSKNITTQGDQNRDQQMDKFIDGSVTQILLQLNKSLVSNTSNSRANQVQKEQSQPEGGNRALLTNANDALKTPQTSKASYIPQKSRPPAIPVRSQIPYSLPNTVPVLQQQRNLYSKSQIPLSVHNGISKSNRIPLLQLAHKLTAYNPHNTAYLRSSTPYQYRWYNTNNRATQLRYPYAKRPALMAAKRNPFAPGRRSRIPSPIYRPYPYGSTYNYHPLYNTKSSITNYRSPGFYRMPLSFKRPVNFPKSPIPRVSSRGKFRAPIFHRSQIPRPMIYRPVQWNPLLAVPHGQPIHSNMKYRRMAITDRRRNYNGLRSSDGKISQETPLPLPLASIMTAARIVVPARPSTLNGASKSNVETIVPDDAVQKSARAV